MPDTTIVAIGPVLAFGLFVGVLVFVALAGFTLAGAFLAGYAMASHQGGGG